MIGTHAHRCQACLHAQHCGARWRSPAAAALGETANPTPVTPAAWIGSSAQALQPALHPHLHTLLSIPALRKEGKANRAARPVCMLQ
jgi:hypothetical protein